MSTDNSETFPTLGERVMQMCKEGVDTINALMPHDGRWASAPFEVLDETPEGQDLNLQLAAIVVAHMDEPLSIETKADLPELVESGQAWLKAVLKRKLRDTMYELYFTHLEETIGSIILGRCIRVENEPPRPTQEGRCVHIDMVDQALMLEPEFPDDGYVHGYDPYRVHLFALTGEQLVKKLTFLRSKAE